MSGTIITGPINNKIQIAGKIISVPTHIERALLAIGNNVNNVYGGAEDRQLVYNYIKTNYPKVGETDRKEIARCLAKYGHEYGVDPKLLAGLIARESGFNKMARSKSGAKGLGQLMPVTCKVYKVRNPYNIQENIIGTIKYFKWCLDKWRAHKSGVKYALASYKEGYYGFKDRMYYKKGTGGYIEDILEHYNNLKPQPLTRPTPKVTTI